MKYIVKEFFFFWKLKHSRSYFHGNNRTVDSMSVITVAMETSLSNVNNSGGVVMAMGLLSTSWCLSPPCVPLAFEEFSVKKKEWNMIGYIRYILCSSTYIILSIYSQNIKTVKYEMLFIYFLLFFSFKWKYLSFKFFSETALKVYSFTV